jgi:methylated-DNA-[protein]-cysteine S-methyltransferase
MTRTSRTASAGRPTSMPTTTTDDGDAELERLLRADAEPAAADWAAMRARLAARAGAEDVLDVAYERHATPLGTVLVGATRDGIVRLALPSEDHDGVLDELARRVSPRLLRHGTPALTAARHELDEYFAGTRRAFDVPLDWQLTRAFRRAVLRATAEIPYGATASYGEVATGAGSPRAVRAAGTALATNPIPILVPCHRVLRADGALGQYRGGAAAKAQLLDLERTA